MQRNHPGMGFFPILTSIAGFRRLALLGLALVSAFAETASVHASSFPRWEYRRENYRAFRLVTDISLISSTANYDSAGASAAVPNLTSYSKRLFEFTGIYGLTPRLSAYARLSWATMGYETSTLQGSGFGLNEQALGLNYRTYEGAAGRAPDGAPMRRTALDFQLQLDVPMNDPVSTRLAANPLVGDGTFDITVGPFFTLPLNQGRGSRWFLVSGIAYQSRSKGFSATLPYQLQAIRLPESDGFFARVGIFGMKSMSSDTPAGTATSVGSVPATSTTPPAQLTADSGGSYIVDALNSSMMSARLAFGYQTKANTQYWLGYQKTISGTSTAALSAIFLGAQWRWAGAPAAGSPSAGNSNSAPLSKSGFASYDLEGHVQASNTKLNLVKIDKGSTDGVEKGQRFDFFKITADGSASEIIARGTVTRVGSSESIINVEKYAKEVWIQTGFVAKRVVK